MRRITVEPEQLESCALRMEEMNQDYMDCSRRLYEAVDAMAVVWQGKYSRAFTDRIFGFQTDIRQLSVLCTQYSDFLRSSAMAYRETNDELAAQAARLGMN